MNEKSWMGWTNILATWLVRVAEGSLYTLASAYEKRTWVVSNNHYHLVGNHLHNLRITIYKHDYQGHINVLWAGTDEKYAHVFFSLAHIYKKV